MEDGTYIVLSSSEPQHTCCFICYQLPSGRTALVDMLYPCRFVWMRVRMKYIGSSVISPVHAHRSQLLRYAFPCMCKIFWPLEEEMCFGRRKEPSVASWVSPGELRGVSVLGLSSSFTCSNCQLLVKGKNLWRSSLTCKIRWFVSDSNSTTPAGSMALQYFCLESFKGKF
jgi:hypothetical protein